MYELRLKDYIWDVVCLSFILAVIAVLMLSLFRLVLTNVDAIQLLIASAITVLIHESIHYITIVSLKVKAKIGFKFMSFMPVAYVKVEETTREKHIVFALSPLILGSLVFLIASLCAGTYDLRNVLALAFVMNMAGSSGDLLLFLSVIRLPRGTMVIDEGDTIRARVEISEPLDKKLIWIIRGLALLLILYIIINIKIEVIV